MLILEIDAVQVPFLQNTLTIEESIYNRTVMSVVIQDVTGTYRPTRDADITITDDVTLEVKFAGFTETITEQGVGGEPILPIEHKVHAIDINYLADRRQFVQTFFAAGITLKAFLQLVVPHLATDGVTLDPGQVDGPIMPLIIVDVMSATELLNLMTSVTGYIWEIDYDRVLRAFLPGAIPAPFDVIEPTDTTIGDIAVDASTTVYANRVIGRFGTGTREVIDTFVGDGSTTVFLINYYPLIAHRGIVNVGGTIVDGVITGGAFQTLSIGGGGTWDYAEVPGTGGTITSLTPVANGVDILFQYTSQGPVVIIANEVSEQPPVRDVVVDLPDIWDRAAAEAAVDLALASYIVQPRTVHYSTYQAGLASGMSQTITVAKRGFNAAAYITEIRHNYLEGDLVRYDVTALEGDILQNYWGDIYHEWAEMGGGGGGSGGGGAPSTIVQGGPGTPVTSVQFNRNSTFGGDASFTYNEDTNSLVVGLDSSITAALHESCFVLGQDCHITD